jgi:hypothetical protein
MAGEMPVVVIACRETPSLLAGIRGLRQKLEHVE